MENKKYTLSQREAINWNDGSLLVLAGPGSGKTAVLTERVSRILSETPDESFKILALTFTNKAALEMSERILKLLPDAKGRLFVGTFHGFCADVLRNHGSYIGIKPDFTIFSDENDLKAIVKDLQDEYFNNFQDYNVYDLKILNAIKYFQENLCYTEQEIDKKMPNIPYASMFKWMCIRYQEKLKEYNALDFNSIVLLAYKLFTSNPMVAKLYRLSYKYVCIDEFQDTNMAQYDLVKSFIPLNNSNLFIVADDDQVIYGWNGASNKRLIEFKNDYSAHVIQLCENFRCPESVVSLANALISNNSGRVENKSPIIAMKADREEHSSVHVSFYENDHEEAVGVSDQIKKIKTKTPTASVGIIARNNRLLQHQYDVLKSKGISVTKSKRKDEFENIYIRCIHFVLKLMNRRSDKKLLKEVINGLEVIISNKIDIDEIVALSKTNNTDYFSELCLLLKRINTESKAFDTLYEKLYIKSDYVGFISDAFEYIERLIGIQCSELEEEHKKAYLEEYNLEKKAWDTIYQQINNNYGSDITLSAFLQEFSMASKDVEAGNDEVQCLTIHASKGKEFDYVFVIGLVEDELPSFQSIKKGDGSIEMEEERRNCFVAITRTKKELYLSAAKKYNNWTKQPSRFLSEMEIEI